MSNHQRVFGVMLTFAAAALLLIPEAYSQSQVPPQLWYAINSNWQDVEVTTETATIVDLVIKKRYDNSVLKVSFSGGRLSLWSDEYDRSPQTVLNIRLDGEGLAEALNLDSAPAFRNTYPIIQSILKDVPKGKHVVSITIAKTADEGNVTYSTTNGNLPEGVYATLIVEEWMPSSQ